MATRSYISTKEFRAAAKLAREIEEAQALTVNRFDPMRIPKLAFASFQIRDATTAVSPDSSFRFLKSAIDTAKSTLLLYIYDVSAEYLLDLLADAKKRGVKIRAMYDANSGGADELAALKKVAGTVKAAPSKGDRSVFTVCHQKFVVIDANTVVVESANWAKSSIPEITAVGKFKKANREWFIRFDDSSIAQWFTRLFDADFAIPPKASASAAVEASLDFDDLMVGVAAVKPPGKLFPVEEIEDSTTVVTPIVSPDNYLTEVKALLKTAQRSVRLQQQYILAGKGIKDLLEIIAERRAKVKGFDLRIITSATFAKNWEATKKTLASAKMDGVLKALNPGPFTHCHNKGVIVDDTAVVISSTNWSENSVLRAREAGVLVRSKKVTEYYRQVFDLDWKEGIKAADVDTSAALLSGGDML